MTAHSACVAKVEEIREHHIYREHGNGTENAECDELKTLNALRAVLERHKPHEKCSEGCGVGGWCNSCMEPPFPCPTVLDIAKALGVGE